jgi:hypothetical protein
LLAFLDAWVADHTLGVGIMAPRTTNGGQGATELAKQWMSA